MTSEEFKFPIFMVPIIFINYLIFLWNLYIFTDPIIASFYKTIINLFKVNLKCNKEWKLYSEITEIIWKLMFLKKT